MPDIQFAVERNKRFYDCLTNDWYDNLLGEGLLFDDYYAAQLWASQFPGSRVVKVRIVIRPSDDDDAWASLARKSFDRWVAENEY